MHKNTVRVISIVLVLGVVYGIANAGGFRQDPGPDGIVSIEAENYDNNVAQGEHRWVQVGEMDGFTGTAGMQAQPNIRVNNTTDYVTKSPRLDYKINFVKTGTHYIWLRVWANDGSDDSCHAGLDFQALDTCDAIDGFDNVYIWTNSTIDEVPPTFEVATAGLHTFNIWMREDGCIVDKIVLTTNEDYAPTDNGPPESIREPDLLAYNPVPNDGASDVTRDVVMSWTPGDFAHTHNVYLGTVFNDVNSADSSSSLLVGPSQDVNTYDPGRLEFETIYYWRIDEINEPAVPMTYKGFIWRFTTERFAYPIPGGKIIATSSGQEGNQEPQNTVNNSGLTNDLHSTDPSDMWLSEAGEPGSAWIQYDFDRPYKLHEMLVWNYNGPSVFSGFGIKDAIIEYSSDGINWTQLGDIHEFTKATGGSDYMYNTTIAFNSIPVQHVKITANSSWGGSQFNHYGLSEVRFLQIPVYASEPNPADGKADAAIDVTLAWRAGREAAEHNVYLSKDQQAVIEGTAPVVTISQASYGPLSLDLDGTYFWRVEEVNDAEVIPLWQGDIWSFTTSDYLIVDNFESYNDLNPEEEGSNRIYLTWIDGFENPTTNGSTMGYPDPVFADGEHFVETTIIHGGNQAAPIFYDNTVANISEVTVNTDELPVGGDWTLGSPEVLSLWVYGDPNNSSTDQMYVKVNETRVNYDGDLTLEQWQEFSIDLAALRIDLSSITTLIIGFERTGTTGGSGMVFVDDILLYSPLND